MDELSKEVRKIPQLKENEQYILGKYTFRVSELSSENEYTSQLPYDAWNMMSIKIRGGL